MKTPIKMPHPEWLNQIVEEVVSPDLPIVDCHHHFYKDRGNYFPYQPHYLAEHLAEDLNDGHNIVATIGVERRIG